MQTPRVSVSSIRISPGPAADATFRLGMIAGGIVGLVGVGLMYWFGMLSLLLTGYVMLVLFPPYLILVATVLSVWLGYNQDATSLRPVNRTN